MQRSQELKGKDAFTKLVYYVENDPKIFPNIFAKIEGENKPSQTIPGSIVNDVIDLEKGHFDEVVYLTPIDP